MSPPPPFHERRRFGLWKESKGVGDFTGGSRRMAESRDGMEYGVKIKVAFFMKMLNVD